MRDVYGMCHDADILQSLLDLNGKIYEKEQRGERVQDPGLPDRVKDKSELISDDCVRLLDESKVKEKI